MSIVNTNGSGYKKRANGQGSKPHQRKDGRWEIRYTEDTPKGKKRRALYAKTEEQAWNKLYAALGWWDEDTHDPEVEEDHGDHVYFIQAVTGGPIKIGSTSNVHKRFKTLDASSPIPLKILHVIHGAGRETERQLHRRFKHHRLRYEWFDASIELLQYIHYLRSKDNHPLSSMTTTQNAMGVHGQP